MDDDPRTITSPVLSKPSIKRQFDLLSAAVDENQKRIDYTMAHDPEVQRAIEMVERFLRRKRRICYGGQAINALLPKGRQFYDDKYNIPDYDFFTPTFEEDTDELIAELEKAGFANVNKKLSIHDGTSKVLVNFIPVADCTDMHPVIFSILQKRAKAVNGILYADPEFLRMMMYLELSRPRGQVERWKKVYERLTLLNHEYPVKECSSEVQTSQVDADDKRAVLNFCLKRKSVMLGPQFIELLDSNKSTTHLRSLSAKGGPLIFLSDKALLDAQDIRDILLNLHGGKGSVKVNEEFALSTNLFNFVTVTYRNQNIALIFQEDSCHSYTVLKVDGGAEMRIGTPDLMLQMYYSMMIFGKKEKAFFKTPLDCLVSKLHSIEKRARNSPTSFVPAFALRCSGHQQGIATLLREKAERTDREKSKTRKKKLTKSKTRSRRRV
jgi:hypothetical protein